MRRCLRLGKITGTSASSSVDVVCLHIFLLVYSGTTG